MRSRQYDANGRIPGRPLALETWSGLAVEPLNLQVEDIEVLDIAKALSQICRYGGHTGGHLSVARHSLWVADTVAGWGYGIEVQLHALLHDAAEAYLGDIVAPLKHSGQLQAYLDGEAKAEQAIASAFGLKLPRPDVIKVADRHVLLVLEQDCGKGYRWTWDTSAVIDRKQWLSRFYKLILDRSQLEE